MSIDLLLITMQKPTCGIHTEMLTPYTVIVTATMSTD